MVQGDLRCRAIAMGMVATVVLAEVVVEHSFRKIFVQKFVVGN